MISTVIPSLTSLLMFMLPYMRFHDLLADRKAQSCALRLGREEGMLGVLQILFTHPATVVGHRNTQGSRAVTFLKT
jgi:hypothetical protein